MKFVNLETGETIYSTYSIVGFDFIFKYSHSKITLNAVRSVKAGVETIITVYDDYFVTEDYYTLMVINRETGEKFLVMRD